MSIKILITLLAIVNPLAGVPFFIHYTQGFSDQARRKTVWMAAFTGFMVIAVCSLVGLDILGFFGISLASFQVGGGLMLLLSALSMLNAEPAEAKAMHLDLDDVPTTQTTPHHHTQVAVVPLAIPLLTGPATMSTVVIYANQAKTWADHMVLLGYGLMVGLAIALCFALAGSIERLLGQTGINIMTRLMGLILAALAIEVMATGLMALFPALAGTR